jgi:putative DNA primase/helicase
MGIHAELGAAGLDLWDAWSSRSSKYQGRADIEQHYRSFKPGSVTGATLFKIAMDAGWQPPKPPRRGQRPARNAAAATPAGAFVLSEDSLAQCFENEWKDNLAFAHKFGHWYIQDKKTGIWARDYTDRVFHWLREFIRKLNAEQAAKWSKAAVVSSVERFARAAPSFALTGDEFDANNWLLGTPSGVIDLRTRAAVTPAPGDYVSKRTAVSVGAGTPRLWLDFLEQATKGNAELIDYLQRLCGYCLTGETREEVLVFMHGPGGNGKGVFMGAMRDIMGEYARQAPMQVFLANNGDRHPTELANLHGARLVLGSESPEGKRWDEE